MPHWRHMMSSDKLHAADLMGREATVQITKVVQGEYPDHEDPKKKIKKPDVYFEGKKKPLGLNSTNARSISKLVGSPRTEDWIGRWITLYPTTTRAFGEEHECIRVKNRLPKEDQGPTKRHRDNPPPPIRTERDAEPTQDGQYLPGIAPTPQWPVSEEDHDKARSSEERDALLKREHEAAEQNRKHVEAGRPSYPATSRDESPVAQLERRFAACTTKAEHAQLMTEMGALWKSLSKADRARLQEAADQAPIGMPDDAR